MKLPTKRSAVLAIAFSTLMSCLPAIGNAKQRPEPALFQVGAAVVDVTPTTPLYIGGYGKQTLVSESHDALEVRAFVVAKGDKAVAFVIVDSTGWFAEYQGAEAGLGTLGARMLAAQKLVEHGFAADRSAVMVSTTHVHAAPTITGIWGTSTATPEGKAYLKLVRDAVVQAVDQAAGQLRTSELWTATGNVRSFVWQNGQGTNHPDGFPVDEQMPVLWARDPATGATNAIYVNVPNHPDQFDGADQKQFSADFPGYVRRKLDATIGGTSVIASGTLGRQEPPGSDPTYAEVERQGEYVSNAVMLALAQARPLTDDTLGSAESHMSTTADNAGLLGLMQANVAYGPICSPAFGGNCTIPRAFAAPWFDDATKKLGTWVTSLRVGSLLYVSNPGESFAEVNEAIRDGVLDASAINVVGLAGDFLGYNWVRGQYTDIEFGSSNFKTYNLGPDLAQQTADLNFANAAKLGFTTTAAPRPVVAVKYGNVANLPGIQFYPTQLESVKPTVQFYVNKTTPQNRRNDPLSDITWDFGDGSAPVTTGTGWQQHTFPGPGNYQVTATVHNLAPDNPGSRNWTETIVIDAPLLVSGKVSWRAGQSTRLRATVLGGQGTVLAVTWTCPGGQIRHGMDVTCADTDKGGVAEVTVTDGAGNRATGGVDISPAVPR
ncbi:MAG TPA: PKD domain-containing protein [Steroidobacteraceae bacterium]|nr:PKD domain-containing protein [Steroidobacteraceae bacterium]